MSTRLTIFLYYNDGFVHRQTQMNKHILVYIIICSVIYVGYGQPGNPDYLNTLKNIFVSTYPDTLRAASRQAATLMI